MAVRREQEPIPFFTLPNWVKAAAKCGFNIEPVFRDLGIETDLIHLDRMRVTPVQLVQVMDACVSRARGQHFPFALGETFAFDYLPDIETFLATSATLREAARVFDWVRELINPMIDLRLEESGRKARLVLSIGNGTASEPRPYFCEAVFPAILKFGRALLGGHADFQYLAFRHSPPPYAAEYRKFFGLAVRFDQPQHALVFARELLDRPLEGAFPALHKQAEYLVGERLRRLPRKTTVTATVERALVQRPELLGQGIERLAQALNLSPRTLQRRLREEGGSYAQVVAQVRLCLASAWLREPGLGLETISERLGFSDRRSFTRAFTRWSGLSPSAFRAKEPA